MADATDTSTPRWVRLTKAAAYADLSVGTIRAHIACGDLKAVFAGRVLRVDLNSVDAWLRPVQSAGDA